MTEASLNGHQLGARLCAVCAYQGGGSADQGLQEEAEELRFEDGEGITILFQR